MNFRWILNFCWILNFRWILNFCWMLNFCWILNFRWILNFCWVLNFRWMFYFCWILNFHWMLDFLLNVEMKYYSKNFHWILLFFLTQFCDIWLAIPAQSIQVIGKEVVFTEVHVTHTFHFPFVETVKFFTTSLHIMNCRDASKSNMLVIVIKNDLYVSKDYIRSRVSKKGLV